MRKVLFLFVALSSGAAHAACDHRFMAEDADPELVRLGRDLFYDPILSGNMTVACASCHHPAFGTADAVALSFGEGMKGIGPNQTPDPENMPERRLPRNAQSLFNLGFAEFTTMFHDGRLEMLADGTLRTPFGPAPGDGDLAVLIAQAKLPVISADEMAGHYSENRVSQAVRRGLFEGADGAYAILAGRVAKIDDYAKRFAALTGEAVTYDHIARALAVFMAVEWRADQSPYDRYLCEGDPLPAAAEAGRQVFEAAGCATCHAGRFQTDHQFHAIAMPQVGPGKSARFETHAEDHGRMRVTGRASDAYHFRTPSLRNVALTAPYGHAGAYQTLEEVILHHADPLAALAAYQVAMAKLPPMPGAEDGRVLNDAKAFGAIAAANRLAPVRLSQDDVTALTAFLHALTDQRGAEGRFGPPKTVPSGLPVPTP